MGSRKDWGRTYYLKNKEILIEKSSKYQKTNRQRCNAYTKKWKLNNREKYLAGKRKHYKNKKLRKYIARENFLITEMSKLIDEIGVTIIKTR